MKSRLQSWTFRYLSIAGRTLLIKFVLQSIPILIFSALAAPAKVLCEIEKIQQDFLWVGAARDKKLQLVKWEYICTPKYHGGPRNKIFILPKCRQPLEEKSFGVGLNPRTPSGEKSGDTNMLKELMSRTSSGKPTSQQGPSYGIIPRHT